MEKVALVTGATSQDASYLMEILLQHDYKVYGMVRRSASQNFWRIQHILNSIELVQGDLTDQVSLDSTLRLIKPNEVYNLAAQSFVQYSFQAPESTCDITGMGVLRLLEAIRTNCKTTRFFQASSSEMFGKIQETPQKETTRFYPRSPYGSAKAFGHYCTVNYREAYGLHASCGIMFNHESPRRGDEFVTRKITKGIAEYKRSGKRIELGNLDSARDFGHALDYMEAAWLMLQQSIPDDYIIATGETHTVREWLETACHLAEVQVSDVYTINPTFLRKSEVDYLRGDASKIKKVMNWEPEHRFNDIVREMVKSDCETLLCHNK